MFLEAKGTSRSIFGDDVTGGRERIHTSVGGWVSWVGRAVHVRES